MSLRIHSLGLPVSILAGLLLTAAPGVVHAAGGNAATTDAASASLQAERRKLVVDLERANAEIQQLKKKDRGVRDDYRLRARMADAEAIARRLTEIDAKLGAAALPAGTAVSRPVAPPVEAAPTDGPAEWEARADILTDQSRRLEAQAAALSQRVAGLRNRIELRRRAGQLEADPFAPLEGSKRRLIATVPGTTISSTDNANGGAAPSRGGSSKTNSDVGPVPVSGPSMTGPSGPASSAGGPAPGSNTAVPPTTDPGPSGATSLRAPTPTPPPLSPGFGGAADNSNTSLSAQLRDFLDPSALATIRKLEQTGTPTASVEALERAAAALRDRAQKLQTQSNTLRDRAKTR